LAVVAGSENRFPRQRGHAALVAGLRLGEGLAEGGYRTGQVALAYEELADERLNRGKAMVTSAAPLPEPMLEELKVRLRRATGKEIYLEARVDPAILGGLVAQVGSTVYDGSLRTRLRRMREQLLKG